MLIAFGHVLFGEGTSISFSVSTEATFVKDGVAAIVPGYDSDMPAYADVLTDEEIRAVLAFIKSQWPPRIRARHDDMNLQIRESR